MKLQFKCSCCGYETNRLLNFKRHENRKTPCFSEKKDKHSNIGVRNSHLSIPQKGNHVPQKGNHVPQNGVDGDTTKFVCEGCKKQL